MSWIWIALGVWLSGVPISVLVGKVLRYSDGPDFHTPCRSRRTLETSYPQLS